MLLYSDLGGAAAVTALLPQRPLGKTTGLVNYGVQVT
jgi:hypothetical protein